MHHNNAPAHTSLLIREFLAKHKMTVVPHPPYSTNPPPPHRLYFVSKVEYHSERSLISDERRKFAMGPRCYRIKCMPDMEETLEAVYGQ
jgi:transposase